MIRKLKDLDQVREYVRGETDLARVMEESGLELKRAGPDAMKTVCPFHQDTDPSLGISSSKQVWHCFGCKEGGDVFTFLQMHENLTHVQAIRRAAAMAGVDLTPYEAEPTPEEAEQERLYGVFDSAISSLSQSSASLSKWVEQRRFNAGVLKRFGIRWATSAPKGGSAEDRKALQLESKVDGRDIHAWRWKARVVMPMRDEHGRIVAVRTRAIAKGGKAPKVSGPEGGYPIPVPPLYGLWEARDAIRQERHVILVEGEPDVWQMVAHGYENVAGLIGNSFTEDQARYLRDRGVRRVTIMPDADEGGRSLALRVAKSRYPGLDVRIAILAQGDPDEALLEAPERVADALENSRHALDYAVSDVLSRHGDLGTITARMDALQDLAELIDGIGDAERAVAVSHIAQRLRMEESHLDDFFREASEPGPLHNVQGERQVLARMLTDGVFAGDAVLALRSEHFFLTRHQAVFRVASDLYRDRNELTIETVVEELRNRGQHDAAQYAARLADARMDSAGYMLEDVRDKALRREVQRHALKVSERIADTTADSREIIGAFSSELAKAVAGGGEALVDVGVVVRERMDMMHERMRSPDLIVGLDLGPEWFSLNHTIHGLREATYMVLAAPTGVGKTAVACAWARRFAVGLGVPSLYLTFETGPDALTDRMISAESGVETDKIITGYLSEEEVDLVHDAAARVGAAPLILTSRGRTLEETESIIRHDVLRRNTQVVFIDYVQLMRVEGQHRMSRYELFGRISNGLIALTQDLGIRVVALAQINREGTKKGRGDVTDVGDSFIIPQDSDIFYVLSEKSDEEIEQDGVEKGNRWGWIDKHRKGRTHVGAHIAADLATMRIKEVRSDDGPEVVRGAPRSSIPSHRSSRGTSSKPERLV